MTRLLVVIAALSLGAVNASAASSVPGVEIELSAAKKPKCDPYVCTEKCTEYSCVLDCKPNPKCP